MKSIYSSFCKEAFGNDSFMDTNEANLVRMFEKQVPKRALVPFDVDFQWVGTFVE